MIDIMSNMGDDALSNQFNLVFPTGIPGGGNTDRLSLRMDQSLDPPEQTVNVYDIFYRGLKISKTGTLDETDKTLTFDIRLDQAWGVFDDLNNWLKLVFDFSTGIAMPDEMTRTNISIQATDTADKIIKTITFKGVKIRGIKISSFDNTTSEPIRVTLNLIWSDFISE